MGTGIFKTPRHHQPPPQHRHRIPYPTSIFPTTPPESSIVASSSSTAPAQFFAPIDLDDFFLDLVPEPTPRIHQQSSTMAGGKGKSSGGKSSGGKTSANDGPKKQQSHSARAGLQVSSLSFFLLFSSSSRRSSVPCGRYLAVRRADDRAPLDRPALVRPDNPNNKRVAADTVDSLPVRLDAPTFILDDLSDGLAPVPEMPPWLRRNDHRIGPVQRVPTHHPALPSLIDGVTVTDVT